MVFWGIEIGGVEGSPMQVLREGVEGKGAMLCGKVGKRDNEGEEAMVF